MPAKYTPSQELSARILSDFTYHKVDEEQATRMQQILDSSLGLATIILDSTPPSREQSLALTSLEQVWWWANAAIARHENT